MSEQYSVGYGKPPIKHQFKKGKSGNPSGRPKRPPPKPPLDFQNNLIAELKSPITIIEDGKKKKNNQVRSLHEVSCRASAERRQDTDQACCEFSPEAAEVRF